MEKEIMEMVKELGSKLNEVGAQSFEYMVGAELIGSVFITVVSLIAIVLVLVFGSKLYQAVKKEAQEGEQWFVVVGIIIFVFLLCIPLYNNIPDIFYPEAEVIKNLLHSCGR